LRQFQAAICPAHATEMHRVIFGIAALTAALLMQVVSSRSSLGQETPTASPTPVVVQLGPDGTPNVVVQPGAPGQPVPGQPGGPPQGKPEGGPPGQAGKPGGPPTPGAEPKPDVPPVIQRPAATVTRANPEELNIKLDEQGRARVNFRGQPWVDVLNWLADASAMSLDWQELPGDALNLSTQRPYKIEELRDLINRHLLARGFTMLRNDETLTVVNIKKLDAGLVPRIEPEELGRRMPHEFVKVSFPLEWLVAEGAVEELKPMLSPNGKLTALRSSNRLEAMDAVINLRDVYKVIGQEQSEDHQEQLVREFELQYAKASEVQSQLNKLLGIEEKTPGRGREGMPQDPNQMQMMFQQQQQEMMMAMQQAGEQQGRRGGPGQGGHAAARGKPRSAWSSISAKTACWRWPHRTKWP
jgi:hypothetical protein